VRSCSKLRWNKLMRCFTIVRSRKKCVFSLYALIVPEEQRSQSSRFGVSRGFVFHIIVGKKPSAATPLRRSSWDGGSLMFASNPTLVILCFIEREV
jgi:hypothetical protein